jgi:hypothetical protein
VSRLILFYPAVVFERKASERHPLSHCLPIACPANPLLIWFRAGRGSTDSDILGTGGGGSSMTMTSLECRLFLETYTDAGIVGILVFGIDEDVVLGIGRDEGCSGRVGRVNVVAIRR